MGIAEKLNAEMSIKGIAAIPTVALSFDGASACELYYTALEEALHGSPPPFGTAAYSDLYRRASLNPKWTAISLLTNAEREGDGAKRLWSLAACTSDYFVQRKLKKHAVDESRHALLYLALANLAFPGALSASFRSELRTLSPGYAMHRQLSAVPGSPYAKPVSLDDLLQMNIAEIRTTVHHLLQRIALAGFVPDANRRAVQGILDSLLRDELAHVSYTAQLIDGLARRGQASMISPLFTKRLRDFNTITHEELGTQSFDCSVSCCEKRPQCRSRASLATSFVDAPF